MLPGSTERLVIPALERTSGRTVGDRLGGSATTPSSSARESSIRDFHQPPFTIIGGTDASAMVAASAALYDGITGTGRHHRLPGGGDAQVRLQRATTP